MIKNALLSIKKNIGKTILLFVIMFVIANLVIAGLSIKNATMKSMEQVRSSLGSDVTLSYNMKNMMKNRNKGEAMSETMSSMTVDMANQLKDLKYVESYNYTQEIGVTSDDIDPVETTESDDNQSDDKNAPNDDNDKQKKMLDQNDFTVVGNTTMAYLENFTNENYVLSSGRLLTEEDDGTKNCVIEENLASDNDLKVGDTFTVTATDSDDKETSVTLKIVGIYSIETSSEMGMMMSNRQNPINQIYTSLSTAQTLNNSTTEISSATYYLDDPEHIDTFKELAESSTDIDFETYTLDANDQVYQNSISSLENMSSFANMFLWVVVCAGSVILCLILVLTMRSRFYEFGVFLSLGQSKIKIIIQQLCEVGLIAVIAFTLSLGSGKMVSNFMSSMLESSANQNQVVMEMPQGRSSHDSNNQKQTENSDNKADKQNIFNKAMQAPTNKDLDVSLTGKTVAQLAGITGVICLVSVVLPAIYVLRMSPREILVKKEG